MSKRCSILVFNRFYLPGYRAGGPIRTVANMVERLGKELDFYVISLDRDAGDSSPYPHVSEDWVSVGNAKVRYLSRGHVSCRTIRSLVREVSPDVLYLNSFFDPLFTQRVLWLRRTGSLGDVPIVLAPRGEFSKGALKLKAVRKSVFIKAMRLLGLYEGLVWQASTAHERADIRNALPFVLNESIYEALNIAPVDVQSAAAPSVRDPEGPLKVCFLSRISPKKNLDFALRALAGTKSPIVFTIYGPREVPAYWAECEALITKLPPNVVVAYGEEVHPSEVQTVLARQDLFFFPTRGENYGHVIHEALSAGLPVLLSDQTPWTDVVPRCVGWTLPLDAPGAFAKVIDDYAAWDGERVMKMRMRAQVYAHERTEDTSVLEANRRMFVHALKNESALTTASEM